MAGIGSAPYLILPANVTLHEWDSIQAPVAVPKTPAALLKKRIDE